MRILIYGAGVIGSFYASRFAKAGLDVTILARGQRLKEYEAGAIDGAIHEEEGEEKLHLLMVDDHIPAGAKLY